MTENASSQGQTTVAESRRLHGLVRPAFGPGQIVSHITDQNVRGVITAFMVRGSNHSYEVQWGTDKSGWHMDFELLTLPEKPKEIGFWAEDGTNQANDKLNRHES